MDQHMKDDPYIIKVISKIDRWCAEVAGWVVFGMMICISYDVIMRYAFNMPTKWAFEVSTYMMVVVVFLGGGWTLPAGGHVNVDILIKSLSRKKRRIVEIITSIFALFYLTIFTYEGFIFTYEAFSENIRSSEYLGWPLWPMRSFLVIGGILLWFEFLFKLIRTIRNG
ncbi:TRAP transporter small permease subunit [Desulfothermus sp.]